MNTKGYSKHLLLISVILLSFSLNIHAIETKETKAKSVIIPIMTDAQVFADLTDKLPAVVNYFSNATEEQIVGFYQQKYNGFLSQERKRGRLTIIYEQEKQYIRVVISQQNKKRQVDVIVELKENSTKQ
jgi:hypothetical protein